MEAAIEEADDEGGSMKVSFECSGLSSAEGIQLFEECEDDVYLKQAREALAELE